MNGMKAEESTAPISIKRAFSDLHSLEVREPLRKFQSKIMLVAVDPENTIVKTRKMKRPPEVDQLHEFAADCKGTSIFVADTENFPTIEMFREVVMENGSAIRNRIERK